MPPVNVWNFLKFPLAFIYKSFTALDWSDCSFLSSCHARALNNNSDNISLSALLKNLFICTRSSEADHYQTETMQAVSEKI